MLDDENSLGHLSKIKIPRALPKPTESASPRGGIWEAEFLDKCPMQLSAAARQDRGVLEDGKKENLAFESGNFLGFSKTEAQEVPGSQTPKLSHFFSIG